MPKTIAITPSWFWPESVSRVAGIPPFSVPELCVQRHARETPDAPAIISSQAEISFRELDQRVRSLAGRLRAAGSGEGRAVLDGSLTVDNVIRLLAAVAAGLHTRIVPKGESAEQVRNLFRAGIDLGQQETKAAGSATDAYLVPDLESLRKPVIAIPGATAVVNHSNRSLLASVISVVTFLQPQRDRSWQASVSLDRWEGLNSILTPLYLGVPLVLDSGAGFAETLQRFKPGYALADLEEASRVTRDAKREVKNARGVLDAMLLTTDGLFNPGDRQRVGKSFECAALTIYGKPETGAIFAAHPQWYLDESVGIPVTNAHVVPSDPRNGAPIQALWELVESAEVTVKGPALMCGYEGGSNEKNFVDGRFRTGVIASSDANGMIYILPD